MKRVIVIATHNRKKAGEMLEILTPRFPEVEFKTLADYPTAPEPDETGITYRENAAIKAESGSTVTGEWALADDAGLEVDALDGAPGLYSKRFGGEDLPFPEKIQLLLGKIFGVPEEGRGARFNCAVAFKRPGFAVETFQAMCEGRITEEPSGKGGFGYDPIFFLPSLGCTMADLTPTQKHAVSHRGKVLAEVAARLESVLKTDS